MISRSSSSYQPLEKQNQSSRKNSIEESEGHELTSIAVISSHPLRSNAHPTVNTTAVPSANHHHDLDFTMFKSEEKTQWTNFHFVMCIGIIGFFVFWVILLGKMYLPPELRVWGLISTGWNGLVEITMGDSDAGNSTTNSTIMEILLTPLSLDNSSTLLTQE